MLFKEENSLTQVFLTQSEIASLQKKHNWGSVTAGDYCIGKEFAFKPKSKMWGYYFHLIFPDHPRLTMPTLLQKIILPIEIREQLNQAKKGPYSHLSST